MLMIQLSRLRNGARSSAGRLAEIAGVPTETTGKILKRLAKAGLVRSHRGAKVGYALTRGPRYQRLAEVVA